MKLGTLDNTKMTRLLNKAKVFYTVEMVTSIWEISKITNTMDKGFISSHQVLFITDSSKIISKMEKENST